MRAPRLLPVLALGVAVVLATAGAALVLRSDRGAGSPVVQRTTTSTSRPVPSTTVPTSTTTTVSQPAWPAVPDDGVARAVITPSGVVAAVLRTNADGSHLVRTPCGGEATTTGRAISGAHVVLDPGHGGSEPGAVGPSGLREKDVNLAVALEVQRQLQALGARVVLTRTVDQRITLASRAAIATSLRAGVFISIHHNADPDGPHAGPGSETYFQIASPESKRAAGLVYEELIRAFAPYDIDWVGDTDAGAKYRPRDGGGDYYGILSRSTGVPAVLSEAAFVSNPPEEALLADPAFQVAEAGAITRAVVRFLTTTDPGGGYVEPYPRTVPAGPGGGSQGCVDPPLG